MKKRNIIVALVLVMLFLTVIFRTRLHKEHEAATLQQGNITGENQQSPASPPKNVAETAKVAEPAEKQGLLPNAEKVQKMRDAALDRNVPIDFWGKVIDQNNAPIFGASVTATCRTFMVNTENAKPITGFPQTNVATSSDGLFEIQGMKGDLLTIETIKKDGYETEADGKAYNYEPDKPLNSDPNNPVIFRLWQTGLKQQLIQGDKTFKLIPDGRPYTINFDTGTCIETQNTRGDVQVWVKRPNDSQRAQEFNWQFAIRPETGGILQETNADLISMVLAPSTGYANTYESSHVAGEFGWSRAEWNKRFYLSLHNAQAYGRIEVGVDSFSDQATGQARLRVQYTINPSGSPILR